jgi:hypothetical protein
MTSDITLKKIVYKEDNRNLIEYKSDIDKIVAKFAYEGYEISPLDACKAWEEYSECYAAGWVFIGDFISNEEFNDLIKFFIFTTSTKETF